MSRESVEASLQLEIARYKLLYGARGASVRAVAVKRQVLAQDSSSLPARVFQSEQHARHAAHPSSSQAMRMPMIVSAGLLDSKNLVYRIPVPLKSTKAK